MTDRGEQTCDRNKSWMEIISLHSCSLAASTLRTMLSRQGTKIAS